jgi:hypothetical protein
MSDQKNQMTLSRREFFLSAAASGATALAAKVALQHPSSSTLILGSEAIDEYEQLVRTETPMHTGLPWLRVEVYEPRGRRWLPFLQVPVIAGEVRTLDAMQYTAGVISSGQLQLNASISTTRWMDTATVTLRG